MSRRFRMLLSILVSVVVVAGALVAAGSATARPAPADQPRSGASAGTARIVASVPRGPQRTRLTVYSPAMSRTVVVDVLTPRDRSKPRPTLYMLDGIDGGFSAAYTESGWTSQSDVIRFMADKQVNAVIPVGGTASYYTDWQRDDPVLGRNRWETFLANELPPLIDRTFNGNGVNAIEGVSMGATAAVALAFRHPDLYRGIAAFSGCLDLSDPRAIQATQVSVLSRLGNPANMWGGAEDPDWVAHDPQTHVQALKGKALYVAVGDGRPDPRLGILGAASTVGGALEVGARQCTINFQRAAKAADVPVTVRYRVGLHAWPYWAQDMRRAWPTVARALSVPLGRV